MKHYTRKGLEFYKYRMNVNENWGIYYGTDFSIKQNPLNQQYEGQINFMGYLVAKISSPNQIEVFIEGPISYA